MEGAFKRMRFVGSGALNLDLFYEVSDLRGLEFRGISFRPGGEVSGDRRTLYALRDYLEARGRFLGACGGGSAANTIYALARFGFETAFIGAAGEDEEGERVLSELSAEGVKLSRIKISGTTGLALIVLDERRDRFIFVSPGTAEAALADFDPPLTEGEWLHLSSLVTEEGFSFHKRLILRALGPISLDPGEIYVARGREALKPILQRITHLFATERELAVLACSGKELFETGIGVLFVKMGPRGARIVLPEKEISLPAEPPPRLIDNTGAGDFFDAGVLAGLARGLPYEKALKLGLKVAATSLSNYGRRGCPKREEFLHWIIKLEGGCES